MTASGPFSIDLNYLKLRARTTKTSTAMALLGELADTARYLSEPFRRNSFPPRSQKYRVFRTLRTQKLVTARRIGDKLEITITKKGIAQAELARIKQVKKQLPRGSVLLIMFDFPETERTRRNLWRRYLKWFGFIQVQKSVWQIKYDVSAEFVRFVQKVGADEWIKIYIAKEVV